MLSTYREIASKILFSERVPKINGKYQYINSNAYQIDRYDKYLRIPNKELITNDDISSNDIKQYVDIPDSLGPYEKILLRSILFPSHQFTVLIGALGSGKTAVLNFLREIIDNGSCGEYKFRTIYIDFNNFQTNDALLDDEKRDKLIDFISNKIEAYIIDYFYSDFDKFWKESISIARKRNIDIIITTDTRIGNINNIPVDQVKRTIANFIDSQYDSTQRYIFWLSLLSVLDALTPRENFRILLDNIDHLGAYLQNEILNSLLYLSNQFANIKFFITMRIISFRNLWGNLDKAVIPHCGVMPVDLVVKRLLLFIKLMNSLKTYKNLTIQNKIDLLLRISEIVYYLNNPESELYRLLYSISGYSIKRALKISLNLFNNLIKEDRNIVYFSRVTLKSNQQKNKIEKELRKFVGLLNDKQNVKVLDILNKVINYYYDHTDTSGNFNKKKRDRDFCELLIQNYHLQDDYAHQYVENVYCMEDGKLSTIKLRILSYLEEKKLPVRIKKLLNYLQPFHYNPNNLIEALNSLASKDRRLIWFDGSLKINNMDELIRYKESYISLTKSGEEYLRYLISHPIYIETMILYNKVSRSMNKLTDRVNLLFRLTFELVDIEVSELEQLQNIRIYYFRKKYKKLITTGVFCEFWAYLTDILYKHTRNVTGGSIIAMNKGELYELKELIDFIKESMVRIKHYEESLFYRNQDSFESYRCMRKIEKVISEFEGRNLISGARNV